MITDLIPEMAMKVKDMIDICSDHGMEIMCYCTYRSPQEQAKLYRQSRTLAEVQAKAQSMRERGFERLAQILLEVGPVPGVLGKHVTMAGPGESWHCYRRAADCVPLVGGKAMWNNSYPGWQVYGQAVEAVGLEWAGRWRTFKESPHCQMPIRPGANPLATLTPEEVDDMLN